MKYKITWDCGQIETISESKVIELIKPQYPNTDVKLEELKIGKTIYLYTGKIKLCDSD